MVVHLKKAVSKPYDGVVLGIDFIATIFIEEHLYPCKYQEGPKYIHNPAELLYKCCAYKNEDKTHHNGSEDSPEQDAVIIFRCYTKSGENQHHYKDVINRQRIFHHISCEVFEPQVLVVKLYAVPKVTRYNLHRMMMRRNHALQFFHTVDAVE